jgi:hypothetical protein
MTPPSGAFVQHRTPLIAAFAESDEGFGGWSGEEPAAQCGSRVVQTSWAVVFSCMGFASFSVPGGKDSALRKVAIKYV